MIGEFHGGAHREFSEFEQIRLFEVEPVDAFVERINFAEFGKIVRDGVHTWRTRRSRQPGG
jgi:hypothetical protein